MNFREHLELKDKHAFLSPSQYHWLNYTDDRIIDRFVKSKAAQRGTELHEFAATCIHMGQRLESTKKTINLYVNDSIKHSMTPEQVLYYSDNCFGTADAISFKNRTLKIFDYKSGTIPAKMEQLKIYAALFCLEYCVDPDSIKYDLRIYQNNRVEKYKPEGLEISDIMDKIIKADSIIDSINFESMEFNNE